MNILRCHRFDVEYIYCVRLVGLSLVNRSFITQSIINSVNWLNTKYTLSTRSPASTSARTRDERKKTRRLETTTTFILAHESHHGDGFSEKFVIKMLWLRLLLYINETRACFFPFRSFLPICECGWDEVGQVVSITLY